MPDTLVFIPAWNEESSLPGVLAEAHAALPGVDLLVVDDGSTDGTAAAAHAAEADVVSTAHQIEAKPSPRGAPAELRPRGVIVRRGSGADAEFDFELDDGNVIPVGTGADLLNPRKVEAAVLGTANIVLAYHGPKQFRTLARLFPAITVTVETGGGKAVEAKHWLATYTDRLGLRAAIDLDDKAGELFDVIEGNRGADASPFRGSDGRLYINAPALTRHVRRWLDTPVTEHDVRMRLTRLLGFEPAAGTGQLQARRGDRVVKLRALASPPGFDPEA